MNNTHYLLINEDNNVIAVLKKDGWDDRVIRAIEDETGAEVESISFVGAKDSSMKAVVKLSDYESNCSYELRPTWEY